MSQTTEEAEEAWPALFDDDDVVVATPQAGSPVLRAATQGVYRGDDSALDERGYISEGIDLAKPWMRFHTLKLVTSVEEVRQLVDRALQVGRVALDLETEGLDNRIEFRADGSFYTVHRIVGYCLGFEKEGYYIPVRHLPEDNNDPNPNVDSVEGTEAEFKRLCEAAQPLLRDGSIDMLGAKEKDFEVPPRVVIEFWHAKFDQEFLYPITGIDVWSPASFEDGMLMVYVLNTEAEQGLKENAKSRLPGVLDPETGEEHPYEMIKFTELFPKNMKGAARKLRTLAPRDVVPGRNVVLYGCSDAICTSLLCKQLKPQVAAEIRFQSFYTLEKQVAQVVRVVERTRVLINKGEIATLLEEAEKELEECGETIRRQAVAVGFPADFNPSSSAQLADFLFGPQGIWKGAKPEKTTEGQYKTDEKTIEQYGKEIGVPEAFGLIIKYRQINKVRGTYLQNLASNTDELNQLRLNFKQTGAATGRFTAPKGDPEHGYAGVPIQGIPARDDPKKPKVAHSLRRLFIARPGYVIVKADYSSQELRIAASMSGEQKWVAEYEKEAATGQEADLHFLTAQAFFPGLQRDSPDFKLKRNAGKTANFALIYGGGVGAVQRATGCDKVEGARLKKAFDDSVPGFSRWVKKQKAAVKENLGVASGFGRFIAIPDANMGRDEVIRRWRAKDQKFSEAEVAKEANKIRSSCERKATNYPIQSTGADILKISLVRLYRELYQRGWLKTGGDDSVRMLMTVHDEIVFEILEERVAVALPIIIRVMESPTKLISRWRIPLVVEADIGASWAASISWSKVLKGKQPRPHYLEGREIDPDPEILIFSNAPASSSPKAVPALAVEVVAPPAPVVLTARSTTTSTVVVPTPPPEIRPVETLPTIPASKREVGAENGTKSFKVASFRLKSTFIGRETVCSIVQACSDARIVAIKANKLHEQMVVEFVTGLDGNTLLYSAKEGYRVYVPALEVYLRNFNLLDVCIIREETYG